MKGKAQFIACMAFLSLTGCIPDHWPEAWEPRATPHRKAQDIWCYNTLAEVDCYAAPQSPPVGQLLNPHSAPKRTARAHPVTPVAAAKLPAPSRKAALKKVKSKEKAQPKPSAVSKTKKPPKSKAKTKCPPNPPPAPPVKPAAPPEQMPLNIIHK